MKCSLGISNFPLFLCTDHWGRLSYLSLLLLFFGTLHPDGYILPFLLCLLLLTFSQLFVVLLRQLFCLFAFLFLGDGLDHCLLYNITNLCPLVFVELFKAFHGHPVDCVSLLHFSVNLISLPQLLLPHQADAMLNNCWCFVFFFVKYRDEAICTGASSEFLVN